MKLFTRSMWVLGALLALVAIIACSPAGGVPQGAVQTVQAVATNVPGTVAAAATNVAPTVQAAATQANQAVATVQAVATAVPATVAAAVATQAPAPSGAENTIVWVKNIDDYITTDPAEGYEFSDWLAIHNIYDTLVKFEGKDLTNLKPGLAEKWDVKDAGDHWELTFTLKDGVKFASGNPLTSADVVYSWQRAINLNKSPAFLWTSTGGLTPESITAPDAKTVMLKMPKTASPTEFLNVMTAPPLGIVDSVEVKKHETTVDGKNDFGNTWLKSEGSAGSGPYALDHWTPQVEVLLKANPNAAVQPKTPNILIKHVPEAVNQQSLLEKGDADIAFDLTPEQITAVQSNKDLTTIKAGNLQIFYGGMNVAQKPLDNPKVREAIRYAIDYDGIVKDLLSGNAQVLQTIIPDGLLGANTETIFTRDVEKAKGLLKEAGVENGFDMEILVPTGNIGIVPMGDLAAKLQADLAEIGVNLKITQQPESELLATYRAAKGPIVLIRWGPDYADPNTNAAPFGDYSAGSIAKRNSWDDKTSAEMVNKAKLEPDSAKRVALYKELTEYIAHNGPYAVLFQPFQLLATRANVQGFDWNPMGYSDLWTISK